MARLKLRGRRSPGEAAADAAAGGGAGQEADAGPAAGAADAAAGTADEPFWNPAASAAGREEPAASAASRRPAQPVVIPVEPAGEEPPREGVGQHLGNLAHLSADPRRRAWQRRAIVAVCVGVAFTIISRSWRIGLTLAVLAAIADTIYWSRKAPGGQAADKLTAAQRRTRKQLPKLHRAGYRAMDGVPIPGSQDQIDHLLVGRAGVFTIDSETWDKRLPVRTSRAREIWLGPQSMNDRIDHARWEAGQAEDLLSGVLGRRVTVRPAVAVYGPKIPWDLATIKDVDVFTGPQLRQYLRRRARLTRGQHLSADEIERIDEAARQAFGQDAAGAPSR